MEDLCLIIFDRIFDLDEKSFDILPNILLYPSYLYTSRYILQLYRFKERLEHFELWQRIRKNPIFFFSWRQLFLKLINWPLRNTLTFRCVMNVIDTRISFLRVMKINIESIWYDLHQIIYYTCDYIDDIIYLSIFKEFLHFYLISVHT